MFCSPFHCFDCRPLKNCIFSLNLDDIENKRPVVLTRQSLKVKWKSRPKANIFYFRQTIIKNHNKINHPNQNMLILITVAPYKSPSLQSQHLLCTQSSFSSHFIPHITRHAKSLHSIFLVKFLDNNNFPGQNRNFICCYFQFTKFVRIIFKNHPRFAPVFFKWKMGVTKTSLLLLLCV